jgi:predicted CopG family antitoxin
MAKRKISISFKEKYEDVYLYLIEMKKRKENISEYICRLIKADMEGTSNWQEEVRKIVIDTLQSNNFPLNNHRSSSHKINTPLSDEDIELINNLF